MKVYTDLSEFVKLENAVVTVGTFDGIHKGHLKIIEKLLDIAKKIEGSSVLLTFEPHPRTIVSKEFNLKLLTTLKEKIEILNETGIEHLIVANFTHTFSQMTSEEFIKKIVVEKIGAVQMVIGHDHKFGKDRLGDENKLRNVGKLYNFDVTSVPAETINHEVISSTKIRNALFEGDVIKANLLLSRNYSISGEVVKGTQRGRILGFPTANIQLEDSKKVVPKKGVYVVSCKCENELHNGIMNVGVRPTFEDKPELVIEVHLLNFNRDIYGASITVDFMRRLRDEKKFESKEQLIHQIEEDKKAAIEFLIN